MKGHFTPHTEESKYKISLARKGKDIGNTHGFTKGFIPWNKGRKLSVEHRTKLSLGSIGKGMGNQNAKGNKLSLEQVEIKRAMMLGNKFAFKHGHTPALVLLRAGVKGINWRKEVFQRDKFTCVWCGLKGGWNKLLKKQIVLNADHIKPFSLFPKLRFKLSNGRTLCVECHKKTSTFGSRALNYFNYQNDRNPIKFSYKSEVQYQ